jgi:poly-gamma-glutamate capsule biosynthesis protein CapA/YwtB (metallophosphatase superfamily)
MPCLGRISMLTRRMLMRTLTPPRPARRLIRRAACTAAIFAASSAALALTFTSSPTSAAATSERDTIVLTFVGDVGYSGNHTPVSAKGISKRGFQRWRDTTDRIAEEINGDLNFLNVETVVTERNDLPRDTKGQRGPFNFRTHPEGIAHLLLTGFNVFSLANNHSMDYGLPGLKDTLRHVGALKGSGLKAAAGLGMNREEASRPYLINVKGAKVGYAAIGIVTNNLARHRAGENKPGQIAYRFDDDYALSRKRLKDTPADFRILSVHYGTEGHVRIDGRQMKEWRGQAAREDGIDIIVGHHAHVVRGVEIAGNSLIFYGLGNFLHHGTANITGKGVCRDYGLMSRVYMHRGNDGHFAIGAVEAIPITDTHYRPRRLTGSEGAKRIHALNYLATTLDSRDGARGLRFTPQKDGSGLYCSEVGRAAKGQLGKMCASYQPAPPVSQLYARSIRASCSR